MKSLSVLATIVALTTLMMKAAYATKLPDQSLMRRHLKEKKEKREKKKKDDEDNDYDDEDTYFNPAVWDYEQAKYSVSNKIDNYLRLYILRREEQYTGVAPPYDPTMEHMSFSQIHTVIENGVRMVKVEVTGNSNNTALLKNEIEANGGTVQSCSSFTCSACIPIVGFITRVHSIPEIRSVCPSSCITNLGSVESEAPRSMGTDIVSTKFDLSGNGTKIGVMSDSFGCVPGSSIALGDIPKSYTILKEISDCNAGKDEGRAMMELIADVAPDSHQVFRTAFDGAQDFAAGIYELAEAGVDIIVDDIAYFTEPFFQDGVIAQAADDVVKNYGIPFFSAAGNSARRSWEGSFEGSGLTLFGGEAHAFFDGDVFQKLTFTGEGTIHLRFQWNEPFASTSGPPGSASDIDIFIFDQAGLTSLVPVMRSINNNVGGDAAEVLIFNKVGTGTANYYLYIELRDGPEPTRMKWISFGDIHPEVVEFDTKSGTSFGHPNAAYTAGIGAAEWNETPRVGVSPAIQEDFTSAGGIAIYHDKEGKELEYPVLRRTPLVVGPDGTSTTFFGESDRFFFGTSAAAPNVAALAALMLEYEDSLEPCEIYRILAKTAHDMDDLATMAFDTGFDFGTGYGFVDAIFAFSYIESEYEDEESTGGGGKGNSRKLQTRKNKQRNRRRRIKSHSGDSKDGSVSDGCSHTGTIDRDDFPEFYIGLDIDDDDDRRQQRKLRGRLVEPTYGDV